MKGAQRIKIYDPERRVPGRLLSILANAGINTRAATDVQDAEPVPAGLRERLTEQAKKDGFTHDAAVLAADEAIEQVRRLHGVSMLRSLADHGQPERLAREVNAERDAWNARVEAKKRKQPKEQ